MTRATEMVYPCEGPNATAYGLTIREHFAAMAMQGILASGANEPHANYVWCANRAVVMADALIAELAKVRP